MDRYTLDNLNQLRRALFDKWMNENHPNFYIITAILAVVFGIAILYNLYTVWYYDWWWKLTISIAISFIVSRHIVGSIIESYIAEWKKSKK